MSDYRRRYVAGGTYFFTLVTYQRRRIFEAPGARRLLKQAFIECRSELSFNLDAIVLLPDHLHCIWTLPVGDVDFSTRWRRIKRRFTIAWKRNKGAVEVVTRSQAAERRAGVWQPRFWEHAITDEGDYAAHLNYIHYNPVRHGYVEYPHQWEWSSFHRLVRLGVGLRKLSGQ